MCNNEWLFSPYNLESWNKSNNRVLLVASEPNGDNPNGGVRDMGNWFRTANLENNYHSNKMFYNRCKIIVDGIVPPSNEATFNHMRFFDLKATGGHASSNKRVVSRYVNDNFEKVLEYFISENYAFGYKPHIIVLLGNIAYEVFDLLIRHHLVARNQNIKWIRLPHPSAQTVHNKYFIAACSEINNRLVAINENPYKWYCRGESDNGWLRR